MSQKKLLTGKPQIPAKRLIEEQLLALRAERAEELKSDDDFDYEQFYEDFYRRAYDDYHDPYYDLGYDRLPDPWI